MRFVGITSPGFNYNLPYPIGEVYKPAVELQRETTVGVDETYLHEWSRTRARDIPEESLMLTGDENIVDVGFKVLWRDHEHDGRHHRLSLQQVQEPAAQRSKPWQRAPCVRSSVARTSTRS